MMMMMMMMIQETKQRITEAKFLSTTYSSGTANSQLEQTRADASGTANSQLVACSKVDFLQYGDFSGWKVQFGIDIISWQWGYWLANSAQVAVAWLSLRHRGCQRREGASCQEGE